MTTTIDSAMFVHMLDEGVKSLCANRQVVNDLNVFPIPDGDTGDNMLSTITSGLDAALDAQDVANEPLDTVAARAANGMLLGARGNSGVILSRIFAGLASGFAGTTAADVRGFGNALHCGAIEAYKAVSVPVEGTMLTVFREAVERANRESDIDASFDEYFDVLWDEVKRSLERTPELLSVLKEAGVVDSGGAGIMYIVEGMVSAIKSGSAEFGGGLARPAADEHNSAHNRPDISKFTEDSVLEFGYCTEFLLRLQRAKVGATETFDIAPLAAYLNEAGESVVCFKDGSIVKVHVHTYNPGDILNYFRKFGEFLTIKIENMALQHNENMPGARPESGANADQSADASADGHNADGTCGCVDAAAPSASSSPAAPSAAAAVNEPGPAAAPSPVDTGRSGAEVQLRSKVRKKFATVAVGAGEGIKDTFLSLGVDAVVDGGQSMNPSAGDFVAAFRTLDAECILVFPNNGNIVLTAEQAANLYDGADVRVVRTKTIGAGYAALSMLDLSSGDPDTVVKEAEAAGKAAVTAHVAPASRDTEIDGVSARKGEYLGFTEERVYVCSPDRETAALELARKLDAGEHDVVLIFSGIGTDPEQAAGLADTLTREYRRTEFIYIDGGQPVYDYILIFE